MTAALLMPAAPAIAKPAAAAGCADARHADAHPR